MMKRKGNMNRLLVRNRDLIHILLSLTIILCHFGIGVQSLPLTILDSARPKCVKVMDIAGGETALIHYHSPGKPKQMDETDIHFISNY